LRFLRMFWERHFFFSFFKAIFSKIGFVSKN
jgi:hypothetical protein